MGRGLSQGSPQAREERGLPTLPSISLQTAYLSPWVALPTRGPLVGGDRDTVYSLQAALHLSPPLDAAAFCCFPTAGKPQAPRPVLAPAHPASCTL